MSAKRREWSAARIHTRERRNVRGKAGRWRDFASSGRPRAKCPISRLQTIGWNCHAPVTGRRLSPCLAGGTSLERIEPESLTPVLSEFVHGNMWWHWAVLTTKSCKRPVNGCKWLQKNDRQSITGSACSPKFAVSGLGRRLSHHCDFTVALLGCGVDMNCVACRTPSPIGVGTVTRKGTITRVPAMGASQSSISRSCMRYLIA